MERRPVYIVLVGLPGSGKSTLRNNICMSWAQSELIVLSSDDEIDRYALQEGRTYGEVFAEHIEPAQLMLRTEREKALARNQSIIHDQTHLTLKSRSRSIFNVPDNYYKIAIVCSVPEDVRQQRLLGRPGKIIPVEADERMVSSFIHPEIDGGFYDGVYAVGQAMRVLMPYLIRRN
jgi:adenylate kinase family enzyme